jgi:hypothetical protein
MKDITLHDRCCSFWNFHITFCISAAETFVIQSIFPLQKLSWYNRYFRCWNFRDTVDISVAETVVIQSILPLLKLSWYNWYFLCLCFYSTIGIVAVATSELLDEFIYTTPWIRGLHACQLINNDSSCYWNNKMQLCYSGRRRNRYCFC